MLQGDQEDPVLPESLKEVSDPWGFNSDGLARWYGKDNKYSRK